MTIDAETMMLGAQLRTVLRGGLLAEPDVRLGIVANRYADAEGNVVSYDVSVIGHDGTQVESVNIPSGSASYGIGQAVQLERVGGSALGYYRLAERIGPYGTETPALIGGTTTFTPTLITGLGFHIPKGDGCIIVGGTLVRDPNPRVTGTRVRICANGVKGLTDAGNGDRMAFMLATEDHTTFENDQPVSIGAGDAQLGYRDTGHLYVDSAGGSFAWRVGTQTLWQSQMVGDLPYTQMAGLLRLSDTYVGEGIEMGKDHRDAYIIQLLNKYGIPLILMRAGFDDDPNRAYMRIGPPPPHPNIEISSYPDGTPYIIMDGAALRPSSVTYNSLNILQISDISGNMGVLQAGRAEFLQPGTSFVHWLNLGNATGIVLGYDDQTQTGRILGLDGGVIQTEMDGTGRLLWGAGNGWADADGINFETGTNQYNGWMWRTSGNPFLLVYGVASSAVDDTNAMYMVSQSTTKGAGLHLYSNSGDSNPAEAIVFGKAGSPTALHGALLFTGAAAYGNGIASFNSLPFFLSIASGETAASNALTVDVSHHFLFGSDWLTTPQANQRYVFHVTTNKTGMRLYTSGTQTGDWFDMVDAAGTKLAVAGGGAFTSKVYSALTDTHAVHTWGHNTSGTAAASFALRHLYQLESSTTADQDAAAMDVLWTTATHASRTAAMRWLLVNNAGALAEYMRLTPVGLRLNTTGTASGILHARGLSADSGVVARFTNSDFIVSTQGSSLVVGQGATTGDTYSYLQATRAGATIVTNLVLNPSGGNVQVGTGTAFTGMTRGLYLDQGAADDFILAFGSSDIAHGMTSIAETQAYFVAAKQDANAGGAALVGFAETGVSIGLFLAANVTDGNTTKSTAGLAGVVARSSKKSGTSIGAHGSDENIFAVRNHTSTKFIVDAEGDIHYDGTANTYDDYDDVQLVRALDHALAPANIVRNQFDAWLKYNRADVVAAGILSDGGFVNLTQLTRLHSGAIWQMHTQMMELRQEIAALKERLN